MPLTEEPSFKHADEHEWRYPIGPCRIGGTSYDVACALLKRDGALYQLTFVCPHCQRVFKRENRNRDTAYEGILGDIQWHLMSEHGDLSGRESL